MRTTSEYLSLQLAYDPQRLRALVSAERLSTARFEAVYREMAGFGMLDLVFEDGDEIFVAHAINVDITVLATREGPALIWPSTFAIAPDAAAAIEEQVTPWLLTLVRGRGVAGEYVRAFRPSPAFNLARERGLRGAVATRETLPAMAPFVYARRFARERNVYVGCAQRAFAAAVVGTVARGIVLGGARDEFAERWFGVPVESGAVTAAPDVAIVDWYGDPQASGCAYVVATHPHPGARNVVIPVPVAQDHLFTFDPADAPPAGSFAVRAADWVERPVRRAEIPAAVGGSSGHVALVVREDAPFAPDGDTEAVEEFARRLRAEGLQATLCASDDPLLREANIVHIFGGIADKHVAQAADAARAAGRPFVVSVEPLAPFARYDEEASMMTLKICVDETDRAMYLAMFDQVRLRFDSLPHERTPEMAEEEDRAFEAACRGAFGVVVSPADRVDAFIERFPALRGELVMAAPVFVPPEPDEAAIETLIPARPFLLLHGPLTRRSAFGYLLANLGETRFDVVVAGPSSEVDVAMTLRRISGSNTVFLPDPTSAQVAALYRRARAIALPAVRPASIARLIRAAQCGVFPLVPVLSPLAGLVPPHARFDSKSRNATLAVFERVMAADGSEAARLIGQTLAPLGDPNGAFRALIDLYARAAVPAAV